MKNKKAIILVVSAICIVGLLTGYLFWAMNRADYYAKVSRETSDTQNKILALEKSIVLYPKTENVLTLADLYVSIGKQDLAEKIMVGRGEVDILNKLGNLYLSENKAKEAENVFTKAKNKKLNSDSLKGLILVELKKGDRGVAGSYLDQLSDIDSGSADCYGAFINLNDFEKAKSSFVKAKSCDLYSLGRYFTLHKEMQNPLYLKLEAANLYYSEGYLNIAEKDILAILKEKDNYRDANVLASEIYEKLGNELKATEFKQKIEKIDPTYSPK